MRLRTWHYASQMIGCIRRSKAQVSFELVTEKLSQSGFDLSLAMALSAWPRPAYGSLSLSWRHVHVHS